MFSILLVLLLSLQQVVLDQTQLGHYDTNLNNMRISISFGTNEPHLIIQRLWNCLDICCTEIPESSYISRLVFLL